MPDPTLTRAQLAEVLQRMADAGASADEVRAQAQALAARVTPDAPSSNGSILSRLAPRQVDKNDPAFQKVTSDWEAMRQTANSPAALASTGAALATGGASLPVQALAQGGAGLASGAVRAVMNKGTVGDMATSGIMDAATNLLPMGVGAALQGVAKPLMRGALRISAPIARKFGDIVPTALQEWILPTEAGAAKAEALRNAGSADKETLLTGTRGTIRPNTIATPARATLQPNLQKRFDAAITPTTQAPDIINDFARKGPMDLQRLDRAKSGWDDGIKNAIVARRFSGTVPDMDEQALQALASEARDALETAAPGYKAINRRIMTAEGIRQAAANRNAIPATGLADNLLAFSGLTPEHAVARLAMSPVVKGVGAIGANEMGKAMMRPGAAPTAEMIRAAILQLLQGQQ